MDYQWLINKGIETAKKSSYKVKMGAVIFRKKMIISVGYNHVLKSARHLHPKFQKWSGSIHAEVDAILKARTDLRRCSILVVRINRLGEIRTSKPCELCLSYLKFVNIKRVYHTVSGFNYYLEEIAL